MATIAKDKNTERIPAGLRALYNTYNNDNRRNYRRAFFRSTSGKILAQASTRGIMALGVAGLIVLARNRPFCGRILGCGAAISASLYRALRMLRVCIRR